MTRGILRRAYITLTYSRAVWALTEAMCMTQPGRLFTPTHCAQRSLRSASSMRAMIRAWQWATQAMLAWMSETISLPVSAWRPSLDSAGSASSATGRGSKGLMTGLPGDVDPPNTVDTESTG
ncbi:Uncharacterised protein [Mycobacteroides abscessus subsp. abscessus]|nr:Uncharacterised protein [Mycobacteroides abscessus subsp. abscessus]